MRTSSTRGLLSAALASAGVALLPVPFALRAGALTEIQSPSALPSRQPWLSLHRDLRASLQIKLLQSWAAKTFDALRRAFSPSSDSGGIPLP
jgi:hypothetical protein